MKPPKEAENAQLQAWLELFTAPSRAAGKAAWEAQQEQTDLPASEAESVGSTTAGERD